MTGTLARDLRQQPDERRADEDPPERAEAGDGRADEELSDRSTPNSSRLREAVRAT